MTSIGSTLKPKMGVPAKSIEVAKRSSLLSRLAWDSAIVSEHNFDAEKVRKFKVPQNSMFKGNIAESGAFQTTKTLYNKIIGNPIDEEWLDPSKLRKLVD